MFHLLAVPQQCAACRSLNHDNTNMLQYVATKRYQAAGFPCNRMLKLSSSRGIRIDVPVLSVSWSFEDHSVIIQALRKGLIEHEASDTGGVPRWKSSCPDRLAEATGPSINSAGICQPEIIRQYIGNRHYSLNTADTGCFYYRSQRHYYSGQPAPHSIAPQVDHYYCYTST